MLGFCFVMRLKSLKLAGFKSFANPTTFTFKHDITAIVGPNGCGKSNVIDAIRWVLGETSAKQLRGGAMSDVIFAGVEGRAGKSLASVELTFEHTQDETTGIRHALNLYHELTLRRQVTKDGKSDYFINGQRVRRRDVVDVFLGTGLGARSYAVIEQGMIGRIVESSPMQLREFIEEGAGVSRYQARREETEKKLAEARDNLERLSDLQGELKKQQRTLMRQAESAKKYQELNAELEKMHKEDLLKRLFEAWQYHETKTQEHTAANEGLSALETAVNKAKAELDKLSARVAEGQWLKDDAKDKYHNAQMAEQTAQHNFYTVNQELGQADEKIARLTAAQKQAGEDEAHATAELAKLTSTLSLLEPELSAAANELKTAQDKLSEHEKHWQGARSEVQNLQNQKNSLENAQKLAESQKQRVLNLREKWIAKHNALMTSEQPAADDGKTEEALKVLDGQIATLKVKIDGLQDNHEAKSAFDERAKALQLLTSEQTAREKRHASLSSEYDILHKMVYAKPNPQAQNTNASTDKAALAHLPLLKDGLRLTSAGEKVAGALDALLGFWLDARVGVPDEKSSVQAQFAAVLGTPDKDAPTAVLAQTKPFATPTQTGLLAVNTLITPALAAFERCYVDVDTANKTPDEIAEQYAGVIGDGGVIFTQTGWLVGAFGALHTSKFGRTSENFLAQKAEHTKRLAVLEDELTALEDEMEDKARAIKDLTAQQEAQKIALEEQAAQLTAATASLHKAEQERTALTAKAQTEAIKRENFAKTKAALDEEKTEIQQELKQLDSELTATQEKLAAELPRYEQAQKSLETLSLRIDELNAAAKRASETHQALQLQHGTLSQNKAHTERLLALANKNAAQANDDIIAVKKAQEQLTAKLPALETAFKDAKALTAAAKIASEEHEAAAKALQLMQVKLQENLTQAHADFAKAQAETAQISADTAVGQSRLQDLSDEVAKLDESFHLDAWLVDVRAKPPKFKDNSARIDAIKAEITKLGAVNLAAAAELAELEERVSPMDAQITDITASMTKLQDAIRAIDEKTKSLFLTALDAVNAELNALFSKVFGGGQASLTLMEDETLAKADRWRAGLVLMAQPKGKKNSRLAVLSGGEKTLTALSLIFAIFKQHPAPFCVLDEVDAPLDDANVGRFTSLIHELADSVQFIFISHNKLAMQIADELKGITMPTAGISSLVTVNLEEAEKYLEPDA